MVNERISKFFGICGILFLVCLLPGCGKKDSELQDQVLIRVGDRIVTVLDFNKALEIAKTAYSHNIRQHPEELRKAKLRLLNQLTIEIILLERAEELGIGVTETELQKAVSEIKSDYPEGEFEETMLELAVSYDSWESRLKTRLIIEKLIEKELKNRSTITPEDIAEYYQRIYQVERDPSESAETPEDINEIIVKQLRRKKAEEAYNAWIEELKGRYPIEINSEQWEKIIGSK